MCIASHANVRVVGVARVVRVARSYEVVFREGCEGCEAYES